MKETDLRISLDMILKSDDTMHVDLRRAILEEFIDRFNDAIRHLKLPSGITWNGYSLEGDVSPAEERKVGKTDWQELAMISRGVGQRPDPRRLR
jgi:hypothetical protein